MAILVYGFEPYGQYKTNISERIVKQIRQSPGLCKAVFPVVFSAAQFIEAIRQHKPSAILGIGQCTRGKQIRLERRAINRKMVGRRSSQIKNNAPKYRRLGALVSAGNARVSYDAGAYVCNYSMYVLAGLRPRIPFAFFHIPADYPPAACNRLYIQKNRRDIKTVLIMNMNLEVYREQTNHENPRPSDFYSTLGVDRSASAEEIKEVYKKLAFEYHPDRNPGNPFNEERLKSLNRAYQILGDPDARALYDRERARHQSRDELKEKHEAEGVTVNLAMAFTEMLAGYHKVLEELKGRNPKMATKLENIKTASREAAIHEGKSYVFAEGASMMAVMQRIRSLHPDLLPLFGFEPIKKKKERKKK